MASWVAQEMIKMIRSKKIKRYWNILIIGFTFKINCPDIRNTQIVKLVRTLEKELSNYYLDIYDNLANHEDVLKAIP